MSDSSYYRGKKVVVTGAASGMGRATARLLTAAGADVVAVDINPTSGEGTYVAADLSDRSSVDWAIAAIGAPVLALFNCAGLPHGKNCDPLKVFTVNFIAMRHLTERLADVMPRGGAAVCISSVAGVGWQQVAAPLRELMQTDWDGAVSWAHGHPDLVSAANCYNISKQASIYYPMYRCAAFMERGLRINSLGPGPTETGMTKAFEEANTKVFMDNLRAALGGRNATAEEQAHPLMFLNNSELASYVTGTNLFVDNGMASRLLTGSLNVATLGIAGGGDFKKRTA
jgi:NAD(P)-dependent dehydrogenase (short-subunit alcohol dehydrogenase family)